MLSLLSLRFRAVLSGAALVCGLAPALAQTAPPAAAASQMPAQQAPAAQQPTLDAHTREDIARHHSMAKAHAQAAQCLESGQSATACQQQLQTACKGLALGKNCGMRHSH
ncbi:hypothetical protein [Comamonas sp. GB3 AK4-5]|uniref:hypothetical protein n=1 Tax=Comamonas sp. GB3 AK4-5 TaxID=3231487 RepID=UPI00351DC1FD